MVFCTWKMNRDLFAPKKSSLKYWQVRIQKVAISSSHLSQWKFGMWKMIASAASWFATDLVVVNVHLVTASFWLHRNHSHSWIRLLSNNLFLLFSEIVCEKSLSVQPSALDRMRLTLPTLTLDKLKGAAGEPWTPCPTAGRPPAEGRTLSRGAPSVSLARDFLGFA